MMIPVTLNHKNHFDFRHGELENKFGFMGGIRLLATCTRCWFYMCTCMTKPNIFVALIVQIHNILPICTYMYMLCHLKQINHGIM